VFVLVAVLSLVGAALIFPGWLWARKRKGQSFWLLVLPAAGIILWLGLSLLPIGAQSLSNLAEVFGVVVAAVIVAYLKFFILDRKFGNSPVGMVIAFIVVAIVTVAFRLFTPELPE